MVKNNWKKEKGKDLWRSNTSNAYLYVVKSYSSLGQWVVSVHNHWDVNRGGMEYGRYFDSKVQALKFAKNWMKRHPEG